MSSEPVTASAGNQLYTVAVGIPCNSNLILSNKFDPISNRV